MRDEDFSVVIYAPLSWREALIGFDLSMFLKVSQVKLVWIIPAEPRGTA